MLVLALIPRGGAGLREVLIFVNIGSPWLSATRRCLYTGNHSVLPQACPIKSSFTYTKVGFLLCDAKRRWVSVWFECLFVSLLGVLFDVSSFLLIHWCLYRNNYLVLPQISHNTKSLAPREIEFDQLKTKPMCFCLWSDCLSVLLIRLFLDFGIYAHTQSTSFRQHLLPSSSFKMSGGSRLISLSGLAWVLWSLSLCWCETHNAREWQCASISMGGKRRVKTHKWATTQFHCDYLVATWQKQGQLLMQEGDYYGAIFYNFYPYLLKWGYQNTICTTRNSFHWTIGTSQTSTTS
jgi:hypothetical protein